MREPLLKSLGINQAIFDELVHFESFSHKIGLKRLEGAVYGLLVLSQRAVTSEEIQLALGLSQSAVAQALKTLAHFGAIETRDGREVGSDIHPRTKVHQARNESLSIVATLFRKREQEAVEEYKRMGERLCHILEQQGLDKNDKGQETRYRRLQSIINTSSIAEAVMDFVIQLSYYETRRHYPKIVAQLPRFFQGLIQGEKVAQELGGAVAGQLKKHLPQALFSLKRQSEQEKEGLYE